jgi:hypothetical protein
LGNQQETQALIYLNLLISGGGTVVFLVLLAVAGGKLETGWCQGLKRRYPETWDNVKIGVFWLACVLNNWLIYYFTTRS